MSSPPLCPLHGEHPELSCPSCDEAAAEWRKERLGKHVASEGESTFANIAFLLKRFARRQPDLTGGVLGIGWLAVAIGILKLLGWILPAGFNPEKDFLIQCVVFTFPFLVLLVYFRARSGP